MSRGERQEKPSWLRVQIPNISEYSHIKKQLNAFGLHTICESGKCPNQAECWKNRTATFMILGDVCTRSCRFCGVSDGLPSEINQEEAESIGKIVKQMKLKHCVITSVTRDDLFDGGAQVWAQTIRMIRKYNPTTSIETLIPDFQGRWGDLDVVIAEAPEIISHNIETTERLTEKIRIKADYQLSLELLSRIAKEKKVIAKSGFMLGLGETEQEVVQTIEDVCYAGCEILTIGQYLQPSQQNIKVEEYVHPERFENYKRIALNKGIRFVESGPLVRSSYNSHKQLESFC